MEDVWALGGSYPRVEAQRAGAWRILLESQGAESGRLEDLARESRRREWALGELVRALKIREQALAS